MPVLLGERKRRLPGADKVLASYVPIGADHYVTISHQSVLEIIESLATLSESVPESYLSRYCIRLSSPVTEDSVLLALAKIDSQFKSGYVVTLQIDEVHTNAITEEEKEHLSSLTCLPIPHIKFPKVVQNHLTIVGYKTAI